MYLTLSLNFRRYPWGFCSNWYCCLTQNNFFCHSMIETTLWNVKDNKVDFIKIMVIILFLYSRIFYFLNYVMGFILESSKRNCKKKLVLITIIICIFPVNCWNADQLSNNTRCCVYVKRKKNTRYMQTSLQFQTKQRNKLLAWIATLLYKLLMHNLHSWS